jgi:hypothetical protein
VRVTDKGMKTFVLRTRYPGEANASRREVGKVGEIELADARDKARGWLKLIAEGKDPARWKRRNAGRRSGRAPRRSMPCWTPSRKTTWRGLGAAIRSRRPLQTTSAPALAIFSIYDLKRSDITGMLNEIKADSGPVMADRVLAHVRKASTGK